jgi:AcrR family transcriptional regulator
VFNERGLQATLDDVARRAGVGVGTVYRRFPGKEALVEALFADRVDALAGVADRALAHSDPWAGMVYFQEQAGELLAANRGLRQMLMFAVYGRDRIGDVRARMQPVVSSLVERAQAAGAVRTDLRPTDMPMVAFMLSAVAEYAGHLRPDLWRRYLALFLDGLRPSRTSASALPEPALDPAEMELALRTSPMRCELTRAPAQADAQSS